MTFLYFSKTATKNPIFINFLRSRYFRLSGREKMNLGEFWETYLGFLKMLFDKFPHNIAPIYINLKVTVVKGSTAHKKCTGGFMVANKILSNRTFSWLSIMGLVNFVAFFLLKILYNLVSMKCFLNANNCWHKLNFGKCPTWPYLYILCTFRVTHWFCLVFDFLSTRKCC